MVELVELVEFDDNLVELALFLLVGELDKTFTLRGGEIAFAVFLSVMSAPIVLVATVLSVMTALLVTPLPLLERLEFL